MTAEPLAFDREIYQEVTLAFRSDIEVAEQFEISTDEVADAVQVVQRWELDDLRQGQPWLAKLMAMAAWKRYGERVQHALKLLHQAWEASRPQRSKISSENDQIGYGDFRYLVQMVRLSRYEVDAAMGLAKLPDAWYQAIQAHHPSPAETAIPNAETPSEPRPEPASESCYDPPVGVLAPKKAVPSQPAVEVKSAVGAKSTLNERYEEFFAGESAGESPLHDVANPVRAIKKARQLRQKELDRKRRQKAR